MKALLRQIVRDAARYGWMHPKWDWNAMEGGLDRFDERIDEALTHDFLAFDEWIASVTYPERLSKEVIAQLRDAFDAGMTAAINRGRS